MIGLLGPGTGLGVSGLIPAGDGWVTLGTEGGHVSFSPRDEREIAVLQLRVEAMSTTCRSSACCRARAWS